MKMKNNWILDLKVGDKFATGQLSATNNGELYIHEVERITDSKIVTTKMKYIGSIMVAHTMD